MTKLVRPARRLARNLACLPRRLARDRRGNVMMLAGFMVVPLVFAVGFGLDYGRAQQAQTKLNAIADSAALVAVSPAMLAQSDTDSVAAATKYFNGQAAGIPGVTISQLSIAAPTQNSGALAGARVATVTYKATSTNLFSSILGAQTLPITGTSVANAAQAPNINFYVMLDNSPSMLLPTTSDGISKLQSVNGGCAFSCHINSIVYNDIKDSNNNIILLAQNYYDIGINQVAGIYRFNRSNYKVYDGNNTQIGTGTSSSVNSGRTSLTYRPTGSSSNVTVATFPADPFWLAENYGKAYGSPATIRMRIDDELAAGQALIAKAQDTAEELSNASRTVTYKMQFFAFNYESYPLTSSLTNVNSLSGSVLVPSNGTLAPYIRWGGGAFPKNSSPLTPMYTSYSDSSPVNALGQMNTLMPDPGLGTSNSTPQEVLFIVTDGYQDELINGSQIRSQWNASALAKCTAIKNRGIRIAILYTTYDPNTILPEYPGYAAVTPSIPTALQSCASTTPTGSYLMYTVSVNQDISTALNQLFAMTVQTAHLSK